MRTPISHRILETVATSAPVFQKQGACLPILHPDAGHTARTVTKNRAHAYQFCIPMPGIPSARFSKTGRMPTNFAPRFRTCRPHGVQKQGAYPARTHLEQSTARFQGAWCSNARRRWVRAWRWSVPRRRQGSTLSALQQGYIRRRPDEQYTRCVTGCHFCWQPSPPHAHRINNLQSLRFPL